MIQCTCNLLSHLAEKNPKKKNMNPIIHRTVRPFSDLKWHEQWGKWHKRTSCVTVHGTSSFVMISSGSSFTLSTNDNFVHNKLKTPNSDVHFISSKLYPSQNKKSFNHMIHTWSSFLSEWVPVFFALTLVCACVEWCLQKQSSLTLNIVPWSTWITSIKNVFVYSGSYNVWHVA